MTIISNLRKQMKTIGYRQVQAWYKSSQEIINDFDSVGQKLKMFAAIPNLPPLYDWIMGFYERPSNRRALRGPVMEKARKIIDVGVGTGYLLSQLLKMTDKGQHITAVDLSSQMLTNAQNYLIKHEQLTDRIDFYQADCQKTPWTDNFFDLYVSSYLFDLLPEVEVKKAISEMERILKPDGYAILVTMTTELEGASWVKKNFYRLMNEFYCLGYERGRWNQIWKSMFNGYAPHCRPIALGRYLRESSRLMIVYSKLCRVSFFPVRIYYVRRTHEQF
jgi:ubiquinone/menaquinone biosynthesis C-methylase UbiE